MRWLTRIMAWVYIAYVDVYLALTVVSIARGYFSLAVKPAIFTLVSAAVGFYTYISCKETKNRLRAEELEAVLKGIA